MLEIMSYNYRLKILDLNRLKLESYRFEINCGLNGLNNLLEEISHKYI